jgi:glutamate-1-semialdehyde 2,1-aminomutase
VVVFGEGYHGGELTLADGGSVLNLPFPRLLADCNDVDGSEALPRAHGDSVACAIPEPMPGGGGCIRASDAFLRMLRRVPQETGAFLIFDATMTSRLHHCRMQSGTGVTPDLMTPGK